MYFVVWGNTDDMNVTVDLIVGSELLYRNEASFPALVDMLQVKFETTSPSTRQLLVVLCWDTRFVDWG